MGRQSQEKGRRGELELAMILQKYGIPARPGQAASYGTTPDVTGISGIHPEVKRHERLNVPKAMEQSVRDSLKFRDGLPAVFHRKNRSPWLVTMRLTDWLILDEKWRLKE